MDSYENDIIAEIEGKPLSKSKELEILSSPKLLSLINNELDKKIVGEEDSRMTIFLICLGGKLTINAMPTSKNLMVNDEAGAGKDYITKSVLDLIPSEDIEIRKRISPTVFTYWHNSLKEPEWTWDGKIFYNEDISNSLLHSDVFKIMSSSDGDNKSTITIDNNARDILVRGKPVMIITTATATPNPELLRRYPILNLNISEDQTRQILVRKAKYHSLGISPEYDKLIMESIKKLKRVKVKVPYAPKLVKSLDCSHLIIRTSFDRFIDYIKFSCSINQYQRELDNEGFYIANGEDYKTAHKALMTTTTNVFSVPLTRNQEKIIAVFKKFPDYNLSVTDLEVHINFCSDKTLRTQLDKLTDTGFLEKDKEDRESSKKPVLVYKLKKVEDFRLPSWEDLGV